MVKIRKEKYESGLELIISGEVDASSSIFLDEAMGKAVKEYKSIIVNLTELQYISSAGLGVFMSYIDQVEESGVGLALFGLSDQVRHIFDILGIDQVLTIVKDREVAISAASS